MYNNPTPVVVGLYRVHRDDFHYPEIHENIMDEVKLVAVKRAIEPFIGGLAFPGGYVNQGETAECAIAREFFEETGIATAENHWRPMVTSITPDNKLLIFMRHINIRFMPPHLDIKQQFVANQEVSELCYVDEKDALCFPIHQEMLNRPFLWR